MIAFELKTNLFHKLFLFHSLEEFSDFYQSSFFLSSEEKNIFNLLNIEAINALLFCNVNKLILLEDGIDVQTIGTGILHNSNEINLIFEKE